ncbi:MAG: hypothetical protein A6F71_09535 [Cycloclasticus sp. symbiont of Poecilosclerida sp. M]|nr:MAG: hypothetical protein A6F71_09535 [Cycloclasticus sp. symbiont of Poecilosclerida sp. M]
MQPFLEALALGRQWLQVYKNGTLQVRCGAAIAKYDLQLYKERTDHNLKNFSPVESDLDSPWIIQLRLNAWPWWARILVFLTTAIIDSCLGNLCMHIGCDVQHIFLLIDSLFKACFARSNRCNMYYNYREATAAILGHQPVPQFRFVLLKIILCCNDCSC